MLLVHQVQHVIISESLTRNKREIHNDNPCIEDVNIACIKHVCFFSQQESLSAAVAGDYALGILKTKPGGVAEPRETFVSRIVTLKTGRRFCGRNGVLRSRLKSYTVRIHNTVLPELLICRKRHSRLWRFLSRNK